MLTGCHMDSTTCLRFARLPMALIGNGKKEGGALPELRLDPDMTAVALDDFLAQCQANTRARVAAARVQTLENDKNPFSILWGNAHAIIAHRKHPGAIAMLGPDMDDRRLRAAEFQRVAEEVLEYLEQLCRVSHDRRQWPMRHAGLALLDSDRQVSLHVLEELCTVDLGVGLCLGADA